MIHGREDYNDRVQDSAGRIPDDEPVFLIRAQDLVGPAAVEAWANLNQVAGGDLNLSLMAKDHAARMKLWQNDHGKKLADL